jgi:nucleoside-diphosphate-sugar epimerase
VRFFQKIQRVTIHAVFILEYNSHKKATGIIQAASNMDTLELPDLIQTEEQLDDLLTIPSGALRDMMDRLEGDLIILGIGGKMGATIGRMALRAAAACGKIKKIIGVSRFSSPDVRHILDQAGIQTIACDLLDPQAIQDLPQVPNVIYMAGKKFGTSSDRPATWAANVAAPNHVAQHYQSSRIVVFSTGCVYPLVPVFSGGSVERDPPAPVGEYAQSCLGRERIFEFWSRQNNTPICLFRLNYAVDLRYGVLHDIALNVINNRPVDVTASHFNVIWQGDACARALLCLEHCNTPPQVLNITGPEILSVRQVAVQFGRFFNADPRFEGDDGMSRMYLSNTSRADALFGPPWVPAQKLIQWQAGWIAAGGRSLAKPTHFEVIDGNY